MCGVEQSQPWQEHLLFLKLYIHSSWLLVLGSIIEDIHINELIIVELDVIAFLSLFTKYL